MLDIAFELIGEATSNSLLMFCFCNLIIVIILTGSSKPGSMDSQASTFTTPVSFTMCNLASDDHDFGDDDGDKEMIVVDASSAEDESLIDASSSISDEDEDKEDSQYCDDHEDKDDDDEDDESNAADVEDEKGDDDLRRRAEDFIAKINNEWRHDKLRALNLVY